MTSWLTLLVAEPGDDEGEERAIPAKIVRLADYRGTVRAPIAATRRPWANTHAVQETPF